MKALFNRAQRLEPWLRPCGAGARTGRLIARCFGRRNRCDDLARDDLSVPLPEIIPVSLAYYTRFPDERGQFASHTNIYADHGGVSHSRVAAERKHEWRPTG
jgi:hypothetical protein